MPAPNPVDLDLDLVNNLEESAYQDGFEQGHEHGQLHGTFEGRDLGRVKGFELWEEVGFYEGTARTWRRLIECSAPADKLSRKAAKQLQHLTALERLIANFPMTNKSLEGDEDTAATATLIAGDSNASDDVQDDAADDDVSDMDMLTLLERIRARYRLTCSVLGIAPRGSLAASASTADQDAPDSGVQPGSRSVLVGGKVIDPTQLGY